MYYIPRGSSDDMPMEVAMEMPIEAEIENASIECL